MKKILMSLLPIGVAVLLLAVSGSLPTSAAGPVRRPPVTRIHRVPARVHISKTNRGGVITTSQATPFQTAASCSRQFFSTILPDDSSVAASGTVNTTLQATANV